MLEILSLIKTVLAILATGEGRVRSALIQPLLTVSLVVGLYLGWHVVREASLEAGLRAALFDDEAPRSTHRSEVEAAVAQAELRQLAASDRVINQLLAALLRHAPTSTRAQLAVFHDGVSGLTEVSLLHFDLTHVVTAPGRLPGRTFVDEPLSQWEDRLPALLEGRCILLLTNQMRNNFTRARLENLGVASVLTCPVTDVRRALLGSVMLTWDGLDAVPGGGDLVALMRDVHAVGSQLASVLVLRSSVTLPPLPQAAGRQVEQPPAMPSIP